MNRTPLVLFSVVVAVTLALPQRLGACSVAPCLNRGAELHSSFTVKVTHDDKPLPGVDVIVSSQLEGQSTGVVRVYTSADGRAIVTGLRPGDYWLNVEYLGIGAANFCFHVKENPTRRSKKALSFEWGQLAPATTRVAGTLVDSQPGTGENPIWNALHRVNIPIVNARLTLVEAFKGSEFATTSGPAGEFLIDAVPPGTYVLHIEGGLAGKRAYDSTDQLLEVSPNAKRNTLLLTRREAGGGSCGGTSLELLP